MLELDVDRKSCEAGDFLRRLNGSRLVFIPKEEVDTCMLQEDVCVREGNVKEQAGTTAVYIDRHAVDPCTYSKLLGETLACLPQVPYLPIPSYRLARACFSHEDNLTHRKIVA